MAVPKKRKSKSKTRSRRKANMKLEAPNYHKCPECLAPKRSHRACLECGYYKGEQVIEVWEY